MTSEDPGVSTVADETVRGRSWRTPFLALGGVTLVIAALFVLALALAALAYALA